MGVPECRIRYILATRGITRTTRVGHVCLYDSVKVGEIRAILRRIASRNQMLPPADHTMLADDRTCTM